jgi:anti-sigma factor RsiW
VGADVGIDEEALRSAAARARKALRRSAAPLAGGARCERAERFVSDRLDGEAFDRRWLDIHLARCPRCEKHVAALDRARAELRASFGDAPPPLPVAPEVSEGRDHLRVVPAQPPVGDISRPTADKYRPRAQFVAAAMALLAILAVIAALFWL